MEPPEPISDDLRRWFEGELRRAKLDAMKELAYGASHEVNNPLANIALRAQALHKREDDPDKRKALEAMHRAAMRAHEMISDLMLFARPPRPAPAPCDLRDIARGAVDELRRRAQEAGTTLALETPPVAVELVADAGQLVVALRAVIENSLDALGEGGEVAVSCGAGGDAAWLRVADNGPGVPAEVLPHVFDPFFSGREAGRGLGFGLSKCWRLVTGHGGDVRLENAPGAAPQGGGVTVTITLPKG
jgi:hypothetical protein